MLNNLLLIILVGVLLGCTTTAGRQYDTTAIDEIEIGKTTEGEMVSRLGTPLSMKKISNGIHLYSYAYGNRWPLGMGNYLDSLQIQFYQGVAIKKSQRLARY